MKKSTIDENRNITIQYLENLQNSWTAKVQYKNGVIVTIWHTALPMSKKIIEKVISVSSDYPKKQIVS